MSTVRSHYCMGKIQGRIKMSKRCLLSPAHCAGGKEMLTWASCMIKVSYFHWSQPPPSFPGCLRLLCNPPWSAHSRTCIRPKLAHHRTSSLSRDWSRRWYMNYADRVFLCGSLNWIRVKRKKQAHIPLSRLAGRKPGASTCHTPAYTGKSCLWWRRIQYWGKGPQPCQRLFISSDIPAFSSSGWPQNCFRLCEFGMRLCHNPQILVCHSPLCQWHPLHFLEKLSETGGGERANALQKTGLDVLCGSARFHLQNVLCGQLITAMKVWKRDENHVDF